MYITKRMFLKWNRSWFGHRRALWGIWLGGLAEVEDGANMHDAERVGSPETGQTPPPPQEEKHQNTERQSRDSNRNLCDINKTILMRNYWLNLMEFVTEFPNQILGILFLVFIRRAIGLSSFTMELLWIMQWILRQFFEVIILKYLRKITLWQLFSCVNCELNVVFGPIERWQFLKNYAQ